MGLWHVIGIIVCGALLAIGLIYGAGWLIAAMLIGLPLAAVWALIAVGPGSTTNPYPEH